MLLVAMTQARAQDTHKIDAYYPESPLIHGEAILFAEMHKDRISAWDGEQKKSFYRKRGCGPSAVAPFRNGFIVLCHISGQLHLVTSGGQRTGKIKRNEFNRKFNHPNDASADNAGGVYFTVSGEFAVHGADEGAVYYLGSDGNAQRLMSDLKYSNGVFFDPRSSQLFVSEHLARRILVFDVLAPGKLGPAKIFYEFAQSPGEGEGGLHALSGPDGLETDHHGNLYTAFYGQGLLFVFSPDGRIIGRTEIPEPLITNVALKNGGAEIIVTGANRSRRKPFRGSVRILPNPVYSAGG